MGVIPVSRSVGFSFSDNYKRNVVLKIAGKIAAFDRKLPVELSHVLRQTVKTHFSSNGESSYGFVATEVH
jgi:hypothetical protein